MSDGFSLADTDALLSSFLKRKNKERQAREVPLPFPFTHLFSASSWDSFGE